MIELSEPDQHFISKLYEVGVLSKDGVILFDYDSNRLLYFNTIADQLIGPLSLHSLLKIEQLLVRVHHDDREYVKDQFKELITDVKSKDVEFRLTHSDITKKTVHVRCSNFLLAHSSQVLIIIKNISLIKEQEQYLVEFGTKKDTILETTTHHFSGALMLMQQLTLQAEKSMGSGDKQEVMDYLKLLRENADYCIRMINDLLKEEHSKSPEIAPVRARTDIRQKMQFVFDNLKRSYPERLIFLQADAPHIYIETDEIKVMQIINNLVSNAIKFTPFDKPITISIDEFIHEVVLTVSDEGVGIPESLHPFIFIKKGGAGRSGLHGERSHGFGLPICKMLAEAIGGRIEFFSVENEGSTFQLILPKLR